MFQNHGGIEIEKFKVFSPKRDNLFQCIIGDTAVKIFAWPGFCHFE